MAKIIGRITHEILSEPRKPRRKALKRRSKTNSKRNNTKGRRHNKVPYIPVSKRPLTHTPFAKALANLNL